MKEIDDYIQKHMTDEPAILKELHRETHSRIYNPQMCSGHYQGMALRFVSQMIQPQLVLEIATFTGYSTICLTAGLLPGGRVFTIESNPELEEIVDAYLQKANVDNKVNVYYGDALDIIPRFAEMFDLVFMDADKREYLEYFNIVIDKVRPGGFIIADNVLWSNKILENDTRDSQTRSLIEFNELIQIDPRVENMIWPIRDGWMVIRKK